MKFFFRTSLIRVKGSQTARCQLSQQEKLRGMDCMKYDVFNPFTAKCGQRQISTKFPNIVSYNFDKQIASCESKGRELSFKWLHHGISSTDSKVSHLTKLYQTFWQ